MAFDPNKFLQVPPEVQRSRDSDRLFILTNELEQNPNDPNLRKEIELERKKQGVAPAPATSFNPDAFVKTSFNPDAFVDKSKNTENTLAQEAARQAGLTGRALVNALTSPITIGGNLLGKSVNALAGREVFQPSTDVVDAYLTKMGLPEAERPTEKFTQEVARSILPTAKAAQASQAAYQAAKGPKAVKMLTAAAPQAAMGAANEVAMDESGDVGNAALRGAAIGAAGEILPRSAGQFLSNLVPSTEAMKRAMASGFRPTLGQGADPKTVLGGIAKNWEDVVSFAPTSGLPLRRAQDKAANQLLEKAVHTVDPSAPILDTAKETVQALRNSTRNAYREPLDTVTANLSPARMGAFEQEIDRLAGIHSLAPKQVAQLKSELEFLTSGVQGGKAPARIVEDIAKDISSKSGSTADKAVRNDLSRYIREFVDTTTESAGKPLAPVRQARAGSWMLKPGEVKGMSSSKLLDRVNKNQEKYGRDLVPELRTLAENAQGIEPAKRAFGVSNPVRLLSELGLGSFTGGLANAGLAGYGMLQHTALPKLLLGDPTTRDAFIKMLRNPAITSTMLNVDSEE